MSITAPRGTRDILPEEAARWQFLESVSRKVFETFGYREIRVPVFEETALFVRGIGEATEVVSKEMYNFEDRKGRRLSLRPEGTAGVVRAFIEHRLFAQNPIVKLYYSGPMFRYERPQSGRQRQFSQVGVEAIGSSDPGIDCEVIHICHVLFSALGFKKLTTKLNSLGCLDDKAKFAQRLAEYFTPLRGQLCEDCRVRVERNPLRILDCKVAGCRELIVNAPSIEGSLCGDCARHFSSVQEYLKAANLDFTLEPRLVRGLDYYTRTVFEIAHAGLGARDAIAGGGRYDNLVESLGGPPTPAVGFSSGVEPVLLALEKEHVALPGVRPMDLFVATSTPEQIPQGIDLLSKCREAGIVSDTDYSGKSLKAQMRVANKLGARFVAIVNGKDEVALRDMSTGEQRTLKADELIPSVQAALK